MSQNDARFFQFGRKPVPTVNHERISRTDTTPLAQGIDDEEYLMNHHQRGLAIIFNHYNFKNDAQATRGGASIDQKVIESAFKRLGFTCHLCENYSKMEIIRKLREVAAADHFNSDCLAVIVMTHGDTKELCAYDQSYEVSKLWEPFKGNNAPSLAGKPKLFFIQACRGVQTDPGVRVMIQAATQIDSSPKAFYAIPSIADILIANATFDGYYAWRSSENGSWFIQELAKELNNNGDKKEICEILTTVNRKVAISHASFVPNMPAMHNKKQMPNFLSTLTRKLYFRPKR